MSVESVISIGLAPVPVLVTYDTDQVGEWPVGNTESYSRNRLPGESLGTSTLTLTNVVVGSRYRIELQSGSALASPSANAEGVAAASTVVISLDYFSVGDAGNDIRIKVRKATSAPKYMPFETLATLAAAAQSVYVGQQADPIA